MNEEQARKAAEMKVFVDMNWPDIVYECRKRGIPVTKKRPQMEMQLINAMTKEYMKESEEL